MKNKKLTQEILERFENEQVVRKAYVAGKAKRSEFKKLDRQNTAWLRKVFTEYGLPTYSLIGKKALEAMFLMVRHATPNVPFQQHVLKLLKRAYKKNPREVPGVEIAYLTDKLLEAVGKPLEYGTLYDVDGLQVVSMKIRDAKNVDKRRRSVGIKTTVEGRRRALVRELRAFGAR